VGYMSERSFFDKRFTYPGYVFILWVLLLNLNLIWFFLMEMDQLENSIQFIGILLSFLTILSGAPIGFLISQFWYLRMNCIKEKLIIKQEGPWDLLLKQYNEISSKNIDIKSLDAEINYKLLAIQNYIESKHNKYIRSYIARRWDILNIIGSTSYSICLGLLFGYITRWVLILHFQPCANVVHWFECYDILVIIGSIIMKVVLYTNFKDILKEHLSMLTLMIWLTIKNAEKPLYDKVSLDNVLREYLNNNAEKSKYQREDNT
jgi:hypothetical protein